MKGFLTMLKMNLKLLFRNKGYLGFVVLLPLVSIVLLNLPQEEIMQVKEGTYSISELQEPDSKILNMTNIKIMVKVYETRQSFASDYLLEQLANTGTFDIYRYRDGSLTEEYVRENSLTDMNHNTIMATIFIDGLFDKQKLNGDITNHIRLFGGPDDERVYLLENNLNSILNNMKAMAKQAETSEDYKAILRQSTERMIMKEVVHVEVGDELNLTAKQRTQISNIGFTMAIVTMAFLYGGIFIAQIVIKEKENKVLKRIQTSAYYGISYALVKCILSVITVIVQIIIMGIGILLFVKTDYGISVWSYLYLIFWAGLVFNLLATVIGILLNNQMNANFSAFFIWCISACIAGLYFPIDSMAQWWKNMALLMPQRWVIKTSEMIMAGQQGHYVIFTLVMLGFLIVIFSIGGIGMKFMKKEQ